MIPIINMYELKNFDWLGGEYGITSYNGVFVVWDKDHDTRVLDLLDRLCLSGEDDGLIAIQESKGSLKFLWMNEVPDELRNGDRISFGNDSWFVEESVSRNDQ